MSNFNLKGFAITVLISIVLDILLFFYTDAYDLIAFINVTFACGVILLGYAVLGYASSEGFFDIAIYGTKKFFKYMVTSKKVEMESYFEYHLKKHENQDDFTVTNILLVAVIQLAISMVLLFFFYN